MTVTWHAHPNAQGQVMRYRAGPFSGVQARGWPGGRNPPLVVDSDTFSIHFVSDEDNNEWGYRFVAWARPPTGWCRAAELMLSEAKDCDRLVRTLIDRSPAIRDYAAGSLVELSLLTAADNAKHAAAALAALERVALRGECLPPRVVDMLLRPGGTGGTGGSTGGGSGGDGGGGGSGIGGGGGGGGGALSPWEKLVVSHACPKLNERLVAHPRLRAATQSLPLLLETLTPERKQAALALLRWLPSLPEGACDALLRGPSSDARGETATWRPDEDGAASPLAALVCDEGCLPLLRALLSREPRLAQPALVAALSPSRTFFYRSLLHRCGLALGSEAIALLLAPRGTDALTSWDQLVLHGPWPLVRELMDAHPKLRQAALRSSRLLAAAVRTPLGCVVALRLIELGAPIDGSLEARLLEHDTSLSAFGRGRRTGGHQRHPDVVAVRGLDEGHSQAPIMGLYVASHEHVTRLKVAYHKGSHDERRLVYRPRHTDSHPCPSRWPLNYQWLNQLIN